MFIILAQSFSHHPHTGLVRSGIRMVNSIPGFAHPWKVVKSSPTDGTTFNKKVLRRQTSYPEVKKTEEKMPQRVSVCKIMLQSRLLMEKLLGTSKKFWIFDNFWQFQKIFLNKKQVLEARGAEMSIRVWLLTPRFSLIHRFQKIRILLIYCQEKDHFAKNPDRHKIEVGP